MTNMFKDLEDAMNKTTKEIEKGIEKLSAKIDVESKKIDLKSQIGNHERKIKQAYTQLGEAYYNYRENNVDMKQADIILDSIKANKKVVELLSKQLEEIE